LSLINKIATRVSQYWIIGTIFVIVLIGLFFFMGFGKLFFLDPQGIHFMRQTDSLSFASKYFNDGYNFFKPQLYNLKNIEGRAICEFPVIYYLTALLYSIFGKKVFILKLLHLLTVYLGVFYIFKMTYQVLKDYSYAILISLFLFTSTVFNYYSFNYLPDAAALGFAFVGWSFIFRYLKDNKRKTLLTSFLFFSLGGLIKVTYLINPLAIILFFGYSSLFKKNDLALKSKAKSIITFGIIGVAIVIIWNAYVLYYNAIYESVSFNTKAGPIWALSKENIAVVWDHFSNYWYSKYFTNSSFNFLAVIIVFQIIFHKRSDQKLSGITLILFWGCLAYFVLFFKQFKDHDYYFMAFLPFAVLILINGIHTLQNISRKPVPHIILKSILLIIIITGTNYSRKQINDRYLNGNDDYSRIGFLIKDNLEGIEKLKISADSKFIIAPDLCQNGGLFYLDKMGWNIENPGDISVSKVNHYSDQGAEYLLLATLEEQILDIGYATGDLIFEGKGISIFRISNTTVNN